MRGFWSEIALHAQDVVEIIFFSSFKIPALNFKSDFANKVFMYKAVFPITVTTTVVKEKKRDKLANYSVYKCTQF